MLLGMGKGMVWRIVRLIGVGSLLAVLLAPSAGARPETTAPNLFVNIHVTLTDTKVILSPKSARRAALLRRSHRQRGFARNEGHLPRRTAMRSLHPRLLRPGMRYLTLSSLMLLLVVFAAGEGSGSTHITYAFFLRALETIMIPGAALGAGEASSDAVNQRLVVHGQFNDTAK